jgi:hypothetical protein
MVDLCGGSLEFLLVATCDHHGRACFGTSRPCASAYVQNDRLCTGGSAAIGT